MCDVNVALVCVGIALIAWALLVNYRPVSFRTISRYVSIIISSNEGNEDSL